MSSSAFFILNILKRHLVRFGNGFVGRFFASPTPDSTRTEQKRTDDKQNEKYEVRKHTQNSERKRDEGNENSRRQGGKCHGKSKDVFYIWLCAIKIKFSKQTKR